MIHVRFSFFACFVLFCLWLQTCGTLVPQPGIKPRASTVKAQSRNQWIARNSQLMRLQRRSIPAAFSSPSHLSGVIYHCIVFISWLLPRLSLVVMSEGCCLVVVGKLPIGVASLVGGAPAVGPMGFGSCGSWALEHGLSSCGTWV